MCWDLLWPSTSCTKATAGILPEPPRVERGSFTEYEEKQSQLTCSQSPPPETGFSDLLRPGSKFVFLDNSPYILKTYHSAGFGKKILIRPRRFGKTVFGHLWLEFFRGKREMFEKLAIGSDIVPERGVYVGAHLDLSRATPTTFVQFLIEALNEVLEDAELPQIDEQLSSANLVLGRFVRLVKKADKKAAFFVDEYDSMVLKSSRVEYDAALASTANLFQLLKTFREDIPFVFITGSSRVALTGLWSGANDIEEISYKSSMASALGYGWDQISRVYRVQLDMLQQLHGLSAAELKQKIESMYNGYRFSPHSDEMVFTLWAINRLMQTGQFDPHFAESGLSRSLTTGSLPAAEIVKLGVAGTSVEVTLPQLKCWRYSPEHASEPLSVWSQLLAAGILTFAMQGQQLLLKVPNDDARFALSQVLPAFAGGVDSKTFATMLEAGDTSGAVELIQPLLQEVAQDLAANAAGAEGVLEYHLQQAFLAIAHRLWMRAPTDQWTITSEVRLGNTGVSTRADFLITVNMQPPTYYTFEFGIYRSKQASLEQTVSEKLKQAEKYFDVARNATATRITVAVWSNWGKLLTIAGPYSKDAAAQKVVELQFAKDGKAAAVAS